MLACLLTDAQTNSPAEIETGRKALSVIARARQSQKLNNWLATGEMKDDWSTMSVDEALRQVGIEQKLQDFDPELFEIAYETARTDRPGERTETAITTIQNARRNGGSSTGQANETNGQQHEPATWPVGLTSHGNTCYLNSLLQYYFSVKPLRDIILNYERYEAEVTGGSDTLKTDRVGQREISMVEVQGGQRFAQDLKGLFQRMIKAPGSAVQPEADLVCRAFLRPSEYALLDLSNAEQSSKAGDGERPNGVSEHVVDDDALMGGMDGKGQSTDSSQTLLGDSDVNMTSTEKPPTPPASPDILGKETANAQSDQGPALPPRPNVRRFSVTKQDTLDKARREAAAQQDVVEVHDELINKLRSGMMSQGHDDRGEQLDELRSLFTIAFKDTRFGQGKPAVTKIEYADSIMLRVPRASTDLYELMDEFFDSRPAPGEDPSAQDFKSIEGLPPILHVNISRTAYAIETSSTRIYKSEESVRLPDEVYLDRYVHDSHPDILLRRKECWEWRQELRALQEEEARLKQTGQDVDSPTVFHRTAQYLTGLDEVNRDLAAIGSSTIEADGDITSALVTSAEEQESRLAVLRSKIDSLTKRVDAQFQDLKEIKYRLVAVFIHRGQSASGHYWLYIHDFVKDVWRKYDDERVTEHTQLDDIFAAKERGQGTPMYAAYVAEDRMHYIQPVCRDPEKEPTPEPDELMGGTGGWTTTNEHAADWESVQTDPIKHGGPSFVVEGGHESWDESRTVANEKW